MAVIIDQQPLAAEELGLQTVGQVLSHLQKDNRLVVQVLLDGQAPDLTRLADLRQCPLPGHTLYIETTDPRQMARDVLDEVSSHLSEAETLKSDAIELLGANQAPKAMEKLRGCFIIWQHAQESIVKTTQLLGINLQTITVQQRSLPDLLGDFTTQLKQIKSALENRDFVLLTDTLRFETTQTSAQWQAAIRAIRRLIED